MARGPYQGTWQSGVRPTVVTAPDALVYINGESDILGCSDCKRKFDWNKYITSVQVDLNIDSPPGSANINLSVPRHSVDEFYFDGNPLIAPMMEVEIYAKGYFLVEGIPQYYPIFWGLVTEVGEGYSGGEHSFSINCADILKWWEVCKMNINPAFTQAVGQLGRNIFGNVFYGTNPYDVIWTLAQQSFGDVVVGTGSLTSLYKEGQQKETFNAALSDIMQYWNQRFSKIRSNLLLYGTQGNVVRGDSLYSLYQSKGNRPDKYFASQAVRNANGGPDAAQLVFDPTDPEVQAFRTQFSQAGQVNFWQSEYQTKLEVANAAKEAIGYEFYMDVTGDIVFKPPFYNLDILSNKPISWIQDIDVIDSDLSESESEVVTQIQLQGAYGGNVDYGFPEEATPYTSVTDYHLLRKYGWRSQTFNSEFMENPQLMFYMGLDMLDRINSRRHRGSVTIPMRPELRLGFPIYLAFKDQIWYIQGISHSINFGGRAVTTLTLTAKRNKFLAPKGIGDIKVTGYKGPKNPKKGTPLSEDQTKNLTTKQLASGTQFKARVGAAAETPPANYVHNPGGNNPYEELRLRHPKTGRLVGYPNAVMAYARPFQPTTAELAKVEGRSTSKTRKVSKIVSEINAAAPKALDDLARASHTATDADRLREKHLNNRYTYGLNSAGVYTYLHDESKVIREMLILPAANIDFGDGSVRFTGSSGMIRPISDERGFEVVGHFRYGRGASLRDGSLVLNLKDANSNNSRADIGVQLALGGGLYESLQAQAQGLSTVSVPYPNPAAALATLAPEDLQTAGLLSKDTKEPLYDNTGNNFVDTAPLGAPENIGLTLSVEASQLSRALTLAELTIRDPESSANCACLLGRSDLAFINVGYQIKTLKPTTPDTTTLKNGSVGDSLVSEAIEDGKPVADLISLPREQLISKVDQFLFKLYSALDDTHTPYQKALRGEQLPTGTIDQTQVRFGGEPAQPAFAPPFNSPNRAAGGDPRALAQQGSSAITGIESAWSNFGDQLKVNTEKAQLQGEIGRFQGKISSLEAEKFQLEEAKRTGSTRVGLVGNIDDRLKVLQTDLDRAKTDLANAQGKMNLLNQKV